MARSSERRGERGLSLLEMMVVLVIAGALVGVFALQFRGASEHLREKTEVRALIKALKAARHAAIYENRDVTLSLDLESGAYDGPARGRIEVGDLSARWGRSSPDKHHASAANEARANTAYFRFSPDGSSSGGRIVIGPASAPRSAIEIDWLTGRIWLSVEAPS